MGATYTRQSTYTDGDVIQASDTNDEFNQLLAAFAASTGHTHDGTTAEGGPITKMLGTSLTLGDGTAGTDITVTFDGESNDGVLKWMEDEDYFEFSDDILVASTEKLQFRDTAIYINSSTDGQLDLVADTEIQIAATTVDINGNVDISGTLTIGSAGISEAELEILDGATVTTTELNIMDGDTSATSTTLADADRVVVNDAGTMKQVALTDFETYFEGALDTFSSAITADAGVSIDNITIDGTEIDLSSGDLTVDVAGDISLDADGGDIFFKDGGTTFGSATNTSGNLIIKSGTTTALTFSGADVTIAGDLTISGDDLTMGTNTSGHIMVADGTNFNPVAVSGDVTISSTGAVTIANGAVETAMVNANVISGLDELNSAGVDITNDDLLIHDNDAGALKKVSVTNLISSAGGLTEVVADTSPQLGGNLDTNSHNILIDDAHFIADENGNEQIIFQTTASAVNQIDVTNAATGNSPEISATGGDTNISLKLTPKGSGQILLDGNVGIESGLIDLKNSGSRSQIKFYCESGNAHAQTLQAAPHSEAASNTLTLPSTGGDVDLVSTASTATLTNKTLTSPKINEDVAVTATATEINLLDGVTATTSELNILDGVTSTATELNILDGVTSTTAELNVMDGGTAASSVTLADADRLVTNDDGTMKQVALTTLKTYLSSAGFVTDDPTALAIALG